MIANAPVLTKSLRLVYFIRKIIPNNDIIDNQVPI